MTSIDLSVEEIAQLLRAAEFGASELDYPLAERIHVAEGIELEAEQPSPQLVQSLAQPLGLK